MQRWTELAEEIWEAQDAIGEGLEKLEEYRTETDKVSAYLLAMGELLSFLYS